MEKRSKILTIENGGLISEEYQTLLEFGYDKSGNYDDGEVDPANPENWGKITVYDVLDQHRDTPIPLLQDILMGLYETGRKTNKWPRLKVTIEILE